jgi:hypothetical protein
MAKRKTNTVHIDEKYTGAEPVWQDAEKLTEAELETRMRRAFFYYNYYYSPRDLKPDVIDWLKRQEGVSKQLLSDYIQSADAYTTMTAGSLARCYQRGMPFTKRHTDYLMRVITEAASKVSKTTEAEVKKPSVQKLSIQDHIRAQADVHVVYFEELEDKMIQGEKVAPAAAAYLRQHEVPSALIARIRPVFEQRRAELQEAREGECEQLAEAYEHVKTREFKRRLEFYDALISDLENYGKVKRAARKPRAKKPVDRARLVKKLNFLRSCPDLKITSIQPQDIVGAEILWIYNTKNRKLGKYVAEASNTLGVRGSTILGYDPVKSVSKTLRKPEQQLAELLKAGKVTLRKFLEDIRAVEVELNGRINKHMLLLKVQ